MPDPKPHSRTIDLEGAEAAVKRLMGDVLYGGPGVGQRTEAQKAREPGFYWCSYGDGWFVAEWQSHGMWAYAGTDDDGGDDPDVVGERLTPPD